MFTFDLHTRNWYLAFVLTHISRRGRKKNSTSCKDENKNLKFQLCKKFRESVASNIAKYFVVCVCYIRLQTSLGPYRP